MAPQRSKIGAVFAWLFAAGIVVLIVSAWVKLPQDRQIDGSGDARVGSPAPDFKLPMLDGREVKLSDLKGKVVVLDFWAMWCEPCVEGLPALTQLMAGYSPSDVTFIAVNLSETPDQIAAFLKEKNLATPVAVAQDADVSQHYGVDAVPLTVVIDKNGIIRHMDSITSDELEKLLPKWIESASNQ